MAAVSYAAAFANLARKPQDEKSEREKQHVSERQKQQHHHCRKMHETPLMLSLRDSRTEKKCRTLAKTKKDQTVAKIPHRAWNKQDMAACARPDDPKFLSIVIARQCGQPKIIMQIRVVPPKRTGSRFRGHDD
jgi:hypothetical protein